MFKRIIALSVVAVVIVGCAVPAFDTELIPAVDSVQANAQPLPPEGQLPPPGQQLPAGQQPPLGQQAPNGQQGQAQGAPAQQQPQPEQQGQAPAPQQDASVQPQAPVQNTAAVTLADTGQTTCYNNSVAIPCPTEGQPFSSQDGSFNTNAASYTVNGDGTVTDLNTGLMWAQDPGDKVSYGEAVSNLSGFSLGGYTDWRLPTITELYTLMDFSGVDAGPGSSIDNLTPFIDDSVFGFRYGDESAGERVIDSQWITSTIYTSTVMNNQECFFGVNFADGRIKCYPTTSRGSYFVIYVRGESYGENAYTDNGDGTITDLATGQMWTQDDSGVGMQWEESLQYCEGLTTAGYTDWRLPNAKELQYLVDYSRSPDATNSPAINPIFNSTSITNEAGQLDWAHYWTSTTHAAYPDRFENAVYIAFGRALGNMNGSWIDVHGAGAQRSDPKDGVSGDQVNGFGPQGDARRSDNMVRCVRDS